MISQAKVSEIIEALDVDVQTTIAGILSRVGANGETTVDQLITMVKPTNGDERHALLSIMNWESNKFAAKLSFAKRCEILALYRAGLTRESLAAMYKIDRRTVTHIYNPKSRHYKNVRQEEIGLGGDMFRSTYLSEDTWNKAIAFQQGKRGAEQNNKYAKKMEGAHVVRGMNCEYEHRIIIQWREKDDTIDVPGWYYRDLDGDYPETWFFAGDESRKTSMACFAAMLKDITDKVG